MFLLEADKNKHKRNDGLLAVHPDGKNKILTCIHLCM